MTMKKKLLSISQKLMYIEIINDFGLLSQLKNKPSVNGAFPSKALQSVSRFFLYAYFD